MNEGQQQEKPKKPGVAAEAAKEAATSIAKKGIKAGAKKVAGKIATKLSLEAAAQAVGSSVPVIGNIAAFIGTEVISRIGKGLKKIFSKIGDFIFGKRDKRESGAIMGGLLLAGGLFVGSAPLMIAGAIIGAGALYALVGGLAIGAGIAGGFYAFILAITAPARALAIWVIFAIITIPVIVAFLIFIINSGALVVPPTPSSLSQESPYISVEKVADPSGPFENDRRLTITYTVTIKATLSTLTNISFEPKCNVIADYSQTCPAVGSITINGQSATDFTPPDFLSPTGDPYVITYQQLYISGRYNDSAVVDIFTVTADTQEQVGVRSSGSATIIIGNPPTECFEFAVGATDPLGRASVDWSTDPNAQANILSAIGQLSLAPAYTAPLCATGPIYLYRIPVNYGGGWASGANGGTIFLYNGGTSGYGTAVYTLAHETGHILSWRRPDIYADFILQGITVIEGYLHTYPNTKSPPEDFAETIGLYVGEPVYHPAKWGAFDYQTRYPRHYGFARDLFGGVEY